MKKASALLTYNEWTILRILWESEKSLSRPEIIEKLPNPQDWQPTAISTLITNMIEKGFLKVDGVTRCGRGYGRTYTPAVSRFDFLANQSLELTVGIPKGKRVLGLVSSLIAKEEMNEEEIEELEQLIATQKEKLAKQNR